MKRRAFTSPAEILARVGVFAVIVSLLGVLVANKQTKDVVLAAERQLSCQPGDFVQFKGDSWLLCVKKPENDSGCGTIYFLSSDGHKEDCSQELADAVMAVMPPNSEQWEDKSREFWSHMGKLTPRTGGQSSPKLPRLHPPG